PSRQQTIRAALDCSHDLLEAPASPVPPAGGIRRRVRPRGGGGGPRGRQGSSWPRLSWYAVRDLQGLTPEEIQAKIRHGRSDEANPLGAMLLAENVASVRHLYS